jgi:glutamyl-tRNA synthetase
VKALFDDLAYLGLAFDGEPLFQSARKEVYDGVLSKLEARGAVYPCYCTRAEIARAASAPHGASDDGPRYPGTCASLPKGAEPPGRAAALRFRPPRGAVVFTDALHGVTSQDVNDVVGDFVVRRNDGVASYQLAVVVDDHESGITHVLRGDDLLGSTPRQLLLYDALGWAPPSFAHVGLVVGPDGRRMAKREGASAVTDLRLLGVPSTRVIGLLAKWCGLSDGAPTTAEALVEGFSLERVRRGPVATTEEEIRAALGL